MNTTDNNPRYRFSLRPFTLGMIIGLAVGLATKSISLGMALGIVFALSFGAFCRSAKDQKPSASKPDTRQLSTIP
jgi:hypothetical protein